MKHSPTKLESIAILKGPEAVKVMFLKPIFEDDFPERGMTAWFTGYEEKSRCECYSLFFDFEEFESINTKYFREQYHSNKFIEQKQSKGILPQKQYYTAFEAESYNPKYSVLFGDTSIGTEDDTLEDLLNYIKIIE